MYSIGVFVLDVSIAGAIIWIVNRYLNIFWEKREHSVGRRITWFCFAISQLLIRLNMILLKIIKEDCYQPNGIIF